MSEMKIFVVGHRIAQIDVERFFELNREVMEGYEVFVLCDRGWGLFKDAPNWNLLKYRDESSAFGYTKALNGCLRKVGESSKETDIIIKTDIDIVFTQEVLDYLEESVKVCEPVIVKCGGIMAPCEMKEDWGKVRVRHYGYGACVAATKYDWYRIHGYDERMVGYGVDDDDLKDRLNEVGRLSFVQDLRLYHLNHPPRDETFVRNQEFNKKIWKGSTWSNSQWGLSARKELVL